MIKTNQTNKNLCHSLVYAYKEYQDLDPELVHQIRVALNQELVLVRDDLKDKIEQMTKT